MKILVICNDYYHPAKVVTDGISYLEQNNIELDFVIDDETTRALDLDAYPLVIVSRANLLSSKPEEGWMNPEIEEKFERFVENGGVLFIIHSGIAGYDSCAQFRKLIGGIFVSHPAPCHVSYRSTCKDDVSIISKQIQSQLDPIEPFSALDEHYFVKLDDDLSTVFLESESAHGTQAAGWYRKRGKGNVYVITPGHTNEIWGQPELKSLIQKIISSAISRV